MTQEFVSLLFLLLLLLDPLGNAVLCLSMLRSFDKKRRQIILIRECLIAGAALIAFVYAGDWILRSLRLSTLALELTGGLMLFMIAVRMVFPRAEVAVQALIHEPKIVPIAIPLIAGPASLATVLLNARQSEHSWLLVLAIVAASVINMVVLLSADILSKLFGKTGLEAMERLMGLALTTMAVQMLISGMRAAFSLPPLPPLP